MAKLIETYEYRVSNSYAVALFNGDTSGMEDSDIAAFDRFTSDLPENSTLEWKQKDDWFTQDEVSGLMADCSVLLAHIFE